MISEQNIPYENWRSTSDKFDYFVLGLTTAVCAYISEHLEPQRIAFAPNTLEILALIILLISVFYGFRRLEKSIVVHSVTHQLWEREELLQKTHTNQSIQMVDPKSGKILSDQEAKRSISEVENSVTDGKIGRDKAAKQAADAYSWRNRLLFLGVAALLASKIWSAYVV
jgi:hypothetical protein